MSRGSVDDVGFGFGGGSGCRGDGGGRGGGDVDFQGIPCSQQGGVEERVGGGDEELPPLGKDQVDEALVLAFDELDVVRGREDEEEIVGGLPGFLDGGEEFGEQNNGGVGVEGAGAAEGRVGGGFEKLVAVVLEDVAQVLDRGVIGGVGGGVPSGEKILGDGDLDIRAADDGDAVEALDDFGGVKLCGTGCFLHGGEIFFIHEFEAEEGLELLEAELADAACVEGADLVIEIFSDDGALAVGVGGEILLDGLEIDGLGEAVGGERDGGAVGVPGVDVGAGEVEDGDGELFVGEDLSRVAVGGGRFGGFEDFSVGVLPVFTAGDEGEKDDEEKSAVQKSHGAGILTQVYRIL